MKEVRQQLEPPSLALIHRLIRLWVVADQHFAERRVERVDMPGKILAVLEVKLILTALLCRTRRTVALLRGIAQDGRAELFVHEDSRLLLWHPPRQSGLKPVIDCLFCISDCCRLVSGQRSLPAEHLGLKRPAMVERQDVQW